MQNMKRALSIVLAASVTAAPCSLGAEDLGSGRSNVPLTDVVAEEAATRRPDSERLRAGLRMLSDEQLGELAARAQAAPAASATSGGGGSKKKTLIIVGAVVLVSVLLAVSIRESCKKQ